MRIGFHGTGTVVRHLRPDFARLEHEVPPEPDTKDKDTAELAFHHPYAYAAGRGVAY